MKKLGFIGCGNMGEAMLPGALKSGFIRSDDVIIHTKRKEHLDELHKKYGVIKGAGNRDVAQNARLIILGVVPDVYREVIEEIRDIVSKDTIIISIAPSFSMEYISSLFQLDQEIKIARTMPNTPAMVGCGVTGISFSNRMNDSDRKDVLDFFNCSGDSIEVKENLMKAVGSVSGSSPAFIYMLIEAMGEGAVLMGIKRDDAYQFAAKAVEGSAKMVLETGIHPGELRDAVCSPGGTTIEGVVELEKNGFKGNIIQAMLKSAEKFQKMQDDTEQ